ncbi:hypothetical protein D3C74_469170 [compost metagenome]
MEANSCSGVITNFFSFCGLVTTDWDFFSSTISTTGLREPMRGSLACLPLPPLLPCSTC